MHLQALVRGRGASFSGGGGIGGEGEGGRGGGGGGGSGGGEGGHIEGVEQPLHLVKGGGGDGGQQLECREGKEGVVVKLRGEEEKLRGEEEKSLEQQRLGNVREGLKCSAEPREVILNAAPISEGGESIPVAREGQSGAIKGGLMATLPRLPPSSPRCRLSLALSEPGGSQHYRPAELTSPNFSPVEMASPSLRPVKQLLRPGELGNIPRVRPAEQGSSGIVMGQASLTLTRASPRLRQIRTSPLLRPLPEQQVQASPRPILKKDPSSPIFRPVSLSLGSSHESWQAIAQARVNQTQQSPSLRPSPSTTTTTPRLRPSCQTRLRPASVAIPQLWHPDQAGRPGMMQTSCLPFCPSWPG